MVYTAHLKDMVDNKLGTFEITSGTLIVSDPCYSRGTWCAGSLKDVRNGKWTAYIRVNDERVVELEIRHADIDGLPNALNECWENSGIDVGVDSGQAGFWDDPKYGNGEGEYGDLNTFYGKACDKTLNSGRAGIMDGGVVSSSGYGDGSYICLFVRDQLRKDIVAAKIVFIEDDPN